MGKRFLPLSKNSLLDLLFPPVCIHCGKRINKQNDFLCKDCLNKIEYLIPLITKVEGLSYDFLISIVRYREVVVSIIHNLKFYNLSSISDFIAELIYKQIKKNKLVLDVNLIIDVPLHLVRKRERGYNQASLIAKKLANLLGVDYDGEIIERVSNTVSQATLEHDKRERNINQAFKLKKNIDLKHKSVILLDDVFTTGSTAEECCKVLKSAGPKKITVLTLGKA